MPEEINRVVTDHVSDYLFVSEPSGRKNLIKEGISKDVFRSYPLTRAFENLSFFVSCDAFTNEVLCESYICSPLKIMNKIKNREGIIFSDLDLNLIKRLRKKYNCLD